jgi:hypothetical protein
MYVTTQPFEAELTTDESTVKYGKCFTLTVIIKGGKPSYTIQIFMSGPLFDNILLTYVITSVTRYEYRYFHLIGGTYTFYATVTDTDGKTVTTNKVNVNITDR